MRGELGGKMDKTPYRDPDGEPTLEALDTETRTTIIDELLRKVRERYLFPEVAERIEREVRKWTRQGAYEVIHEPVALCETLTTHMQEVSRDKHLRLFYSIEPQPDPGEEHEGGLTPEQREEFRLRSELDNFGFYKVERLAGNVGYIDLRYFADPELGAGEAAVATMNLLSKTSALIVDLRKNGGGSPNLVALLCSYLFGSEPVHLNDIISKDEDRIQQFWTLPYVPGERFVDKPVHVLTSGDTFSGAEEFSYNLQSLGRATIVGETTMGGAHLCKRYWIHPHFHATVPCAGARNPTTGTNWEGTGVVPDVQVPQEEAFQVAYRAGLESVIEDQEDGARGPRQALGDEARQTLASLQPQDGNAIE